MGLIADILSPSNILVALEASSKKRAFEQAGQLFENHQGIARGEVFDSLFARERLGSTGLGQGIAIPHGRVKGLSKPAGAFLHLSEAVPFDAPDGKSVDMMFVLLVPEQANETHLQILSELAQMFSDSDFCERLKAASDAEAVHGLFASWHTHAADDHSAAV